MSSSGWNGSKTVRKWHTWRSRAACLARFWPLRDWIGWCICRICEWGRRRRVRTRRREWWGTIERAAMCSIWRSRGREAGWAWQRWTRRWWFLIFACSLVCLFDKELEVDLCVDGWITLANEGITSIRYSYCIGIFIVTYSQMIESTISEMIICFHSSNHPTIGHLTNTNTSSSSSSSSLSLLFSYSIIQPKIKNIYRTNKTHFP